MRRLSKLSVSILWVVALILLDQLTKRLAVTYLQGQGTIPVLGDFFVLVYATNRGGFLSFGSGVSSQFWALVFIVLPLIALLAISIYIFKTKRDDSLYLALWVSVISGGIGNLIDRILYGEVIDFLNVGIGTLRTGIFNFADIYLNVIALIFIVIELFRGDKKIKEDGSSHADEIT